MMNKVNALDFRTRGLSRWAMLMGFMVDDVHGRGSMDMSWSSLGLQQLKRQCVLAFALVVWLQAAEARADLIATLFTASTDYTGGLPNADGSYGYSYPNDPVNQNPNLPAISPGIRFRPPPPALTATLPDHCRMGPPMARSVSTAMPAAARAGSPRPLPSQPRGASNWSGR